MKSFILLFTILLSSCSFSQERINRAKLTFNKQSDELKEATGWAYNEASGEWIDYKNVLCPDNKYKTKYKSLQGDYMASNYTQSFNSIQTKTVTYDSVEYYVLIVKTVSGKYEYPSIKEDWYSYKETKGYIFTASEFSKLDSINGSIELKTNSYVRLGSKYTKYSDKEFLDLIQAKLSAPKSEYSSMYTFPIMKSTEGKIRFYIPERFSKYNKADFEKKYFEIEEDKFKAIRSFD